MSQVEYTVDYFIKKFEAIPEERWISHAVGDGRGRHDAIGHCGGFRSPEAKALQELFRRYGCPSVVDVTDAVTFFEHSDTPKKRVLSYLGFIKTRTKRELAEEAQTMAADGYVPAAEE
jgi:hypothetical protein